MQRSQRIDRFSEPETLLMSQRARELTNKGVDLVNLSLGEPDFNTPKHIIEAAKIAMDEGYTKYSPITGFQELKEAIVTKLKRDNGLEYKPENIMVSTGAKQVLANVILSTINPGDEVIIPTPYWVTYSDQVKLAGGQCVFVSCVLEDDFKMTPEKLEGAMSPKTRLLIFSSPCNPSGAVYSRDELEAIAKVVVRYPEITVVSDEIYEYINYIGKHESISQFKDIREQVVVVNGFSKGFAMTGWRLGYMAAPEDLVKSCAKLQGQITSGANSIAQRAGITALLGDMTPTLEMTKAFKIRKDFMVGALAEIPGVKISEPQGAFYAFPDLSSYFGKKEGSHEIRNANEMTMYLMNVGRVTGVSGSAFGDDQCIRFSFAASMDQLKIAIERIKEALSRLK